MIRNLVLHQKIQKENSSLTNIPIIEEFCVVYEKLEELVFNVNQSVYKYNLSGMFEESIYLRYDGEEGGKYDPHMDMGGISTGFEEISSTIILNDDYEGGDLIFEGLGEIKMESCNILSQNQN